MLQLLYFFIHHLQPVLTPLCFILAWGLPLLILWSLGSAIADTVGRAKQMHRIPCANCIFFTKDYHLKCSVQPTIALSEQAIDCVDYCPPKQVDL